MKTCCVCKENKPVNEYRLRDKAKMIFRKECKACSSLKDKKRYVRDIEKITKRNLEYRERNKDRYLEYIKQYQKDNAECLSEKKKEYYANTRERRLEYVKAHYKANFKDYQEYYAQYYLENKERIVDRVCDYRRVRIKEDPVYKLEVRLRSRTTSAIRKQYGVKAHKTTKLLGCSFKELKTHIEKRFTKGRTWERLMNGEIHIDHIIPLAAFDLTNPEEQRTACHYTNLQPLWAEENNRKRAKIEEPIQMHLPL